LGDHYATVAGHFRARAEQANGRDVADRIATGEPPPEGHDAMAVVRHFEGFKDEAYWDVNHHRVGYGSDTITKPDGTVAEVKPGDKISREDAERDLKRRVDQTQGSIRGQIGNEAWVGLSPKAKASLTSVFYNYGDNFGALAPVIEAAKSGDESKVAESIRGLAGHNEGINAGRRAREANNIAPSDGTGAGIRPQGDAIREVLGMHLPPQEEAAALGRLAHIYSAHRSEQSAAKVAFKQKVDDSVAEAMKTGTTQKPLIESDFTKQYGPEEGAARYADYDEDLKYAGDYKNLQTMSDVGQDQFLAARESQPSARGFARAARNQERLAKTVAAFQKERRDDPGGVGVADAERAGGAEAVRSQGPLYLQAGDSRASSRAGCPRHSAGSPVGRHGCGGQAIRRCAEADLQAGGASAESGAGHQPSRRCGGEEVWRPRPGGHVARPLSCDPEEGLGGSDVGGACPSCEGHTEVRPDPDAARKVQIERDAQRAAQIAGTAETARSTAGQETPDIMSGAHLATPESVDRVVNQSEQKDPEAVQRSRRHAAVGPVAVHAVFREEVRRGQGAAGPSAVHPQAEGGRRWRVRPRRRKPTRLTTMAGDTSSVAGACRHADGAEGQGF
jgi:GH24 family phage-related lysozyme (muramidase)